MLLQSIAAPVSDEIQTLERNVDTISDPQRYADKELLYLAVRSAEGRLYTDSEVATLPWISKNHLHAREWSQRRLSVELLDGVFEDEKQPLKIMDLGCGNGWLSNRLCYHGKNTVHAIDLNMHELLQGQRVFSENQNLFFHYANIFEPEFSLSGFDNIVIGSAIQYFPCIKALFSRLFELLKPGGKIHIIDSPFYAEKDVAQAIERTRTYYAKLGFPEMTEYYHHHTIESLHRYNYHIIEQGSRFKISWRLGSGGSPFSYYIIKKQA
jgi:ubiquinone/menaquinone biosynthesis C-methylase UbiE